MKYAVGNIMQMIDKVSAIVITTNGFTKSNGEAVMGRGIAEQFKNAYPELPRVLGSKIIQGKTMCISLNSWEGQGFIHSLLKQKG